MAEESAPFLRPPSYIFKFSVVALGTKTSALRHRLEVALITNPIEARRDSIGLGRLSGVAPAKAKKTNMGSYASIIRCNN